MLGADNWSVGEWLAFAAVIVPIVAAIGTAFVYVRNERIKQRQQAFEAVHHLIKIYAGYGDPEGPVPLASQLAAIYEFRRYPEYFELFTTLLAHHPFPDDQKHEGLLKEEMRKTIAHLQARKIWRGRS